MTDIERLEMKLETAFAVDPVEWSLLHEDRDRLEMAVEALEAVEGLSIDGDSTDAPNAERIARDALKQIKGEE